MEGVMNEERRAGRWGDVLGAEVSGFSVSKTMSLPAVMSV